MPGRVAGELATHGGDRSKMESAQLADLGAEAHLAADAVQFAGVPKSQWSIVMTNARLTGTVSQRGVKVLVAELMRSKQPKPRQPKPPVEGEQLLRFEPGDEYGDDYHGQVHDPPFEIQHKPQGRDWTDKARSQLRKPAELALGLNPFRGVGEHHVCE